MNKRNLIQGKLYRLRRIDECARTGLTSREHIPSNLYSDNRFISIFARIPLGGIVMFIGISGVRRAIKVVFGEHIGFIHYTLVGFEELTLDE